MYSLSKNSKDMSNNGLSMTKEIGIKSYCKESHKGHIEQGLGWGTA